MPLDTRAKRAAAAHVKRTRVGVTPDATEPAIWRSAVALSYLTTEAPPPAGGVGEDKLRLGDPWGGLPPDPRLGTSWG